MNVVDTRSALEHRILSSEQTFPAAPFPRKYIHAAFTNFQDSLQAFIALLGSGHDTRDLHLMKGCDFVEAVEQRQTPIGFFCSSDDHIYLREAKRGKHMLSVRFSTYEQMNLGTRSARSLWCALYGVCRYLVGYPAPRLKVFSTVHTLVMARQERDNSSPWNGWVSVPSRTCRIMPEATTMRVVAPSIASLAIAREYCIHAEPNGIVCR